MTRVSVYVDGFNLYHGLRDGLLNHGWPNLYWLNLHSLSQSFLSPGERITSVKYFTARVKNNPDKASRQNTYIEALRTLPEFKLILGTMQRGDASCPSCGDKTYFHKEKQTDVNIACQLVRDIFEKKFDKAIVITGDTDLIPAIRIGIEFNREILVAAPPFRSKGEDLRRAGAGFSKIKKKRLISNQFPDEVITANNVRLVRPPSWR